jgi:hypothetical protein
MNKLTFSNGKVSDQFTPEQFLKWYFWATMNSATFTTSLEGNLLTITFPDTETVYTAIGLVQSLDGVDDIDFEKIEAGLPAA